VTDTKTGLLWAAKDNGKDINWANAKQYCATFSAGGHRDWCLPTQDELAGLYDKEEQGGHTPLISLSNCCPWASETSGSQAAYFHFPTGKRYWDHQSYGSRNLRALPVSGGK
jgi:hypothetical protein